jgi:tetratricopeptide (TPR) repeat protein
VSEWAEHAAREEERYRDGEARLPEAEDDDARQRQLTRMGNAAGGAGLAHLMSGDSDQAREWFDRAVERYRESFPLAPSGSWGRPIGMIKARILSRDWEGAEAESRWALEQGPAEADSPIGRYAACLALLVLGRNEEARTLADALRTHADFPAAVGDALAMIAAEDPVGYIEAVEAVLESFETRDEYLEDIPVADTVMVLQALAERRSMAAELSSPLLPAYS